METQSSHELLSSKLTAASNLKKELIIRYMIPLFGLLNPHAILLAERLERICKLNDLGKYEELEAPGPFEGGRIFFSLDAMVHSYYFSAHKSDKKGTRIWKKLHFILFSSSLLEKEKRSDFVQMLEPGRVLSFRYTDFSPLVQDFPEIAGYFGHVFNANESYYHHRNILLNKPALERVREFEMENPLFVKAVSKEIKAMHTGLTRQGYNLQLRKMRKNSF